MSAQACGLESFQELEASVARTSKGWDQVPASSA
jgi:hypothetical protein